MKKIKLTQGRYALVDDRDFEYINQFTWCFDSGYAARKDSNDKKVYMHRVINKTLDGFITDHIDRNRLNNQQSNLRTVSSSENIRNKKGWSSSGHKGVSWDKQTKKWRAKAGLNYKTIHLGRFHNLKDAIKAVKNWEEILWENEY